MPPGPDNTLPTDHTFTGKKLDESTGLMYYGARYYDAALGRFVQADPIVPNPANPQDLNRYAYVRNNPLLYIDPSGHDLMIVGGYDNPNWEYPTQWKAWIMAYKGWTTEEQWSKFFEGWRKADDAGRQRIMQETGVHIFNWAGFAPGVDPQAASRSAKVEDMLAELSRQMAGMKDITLIGHSKGGNLVLNYVQKMAEGGYTQPKNAVLVDALLQPAVIPLVGGMSPEKGFLWHPTVAGSSAKVVNLYNPLDPVNDFWAGTVWAAENVVALSLDVHSTKPNWADRVLNDELQVQFDHGASRWPYLPVIMK
jgi:RHS repeat-associated protein